MGTELVCLVYILDYKNRLQKIVVRIELSKDLLIKIMVDDKFTKAMEIEEINKLIKDKLPEKIDGRGYDIIDTGSIDYIAATKVLETLIKNDEVHETLNILITFVTKSFTMVKMGFKIHNGKQKDIMENIKNVGDRKVMNRYLNWLSKTIRDEMIAPIDAEVIYDVIQ